MSQRREPFEEADPKPGKAGRDDVADADTPTNEPKPPTPPPADKDGVQPHPKEPGGRSAA